MNQSSMKGDPSIDKRLFYRQQRVVDDYDRRRFGSASGDWVNERELALVDRFLPDRGLILDLGCGTGRLSQRLIGRGYRTVLLDSSDAMLSRAVPTVGAPAVLADAFALPFASSSFDIVVALRLAFHFADLSGLLGAVQRIIRPGGVFVFDTYRWSPRSLVSIGSRDWGGKVFSRPDALVRATATQGGFRIRAMSSCFLFSPYLYRLLPLPVVEQVARVEAALPDATRVRVFWSMEKLVA